MPTNITIALQIILIGLSLILGAIVLLWAVIVVLVRGTADRTVETARRAVSADDVQKRAAIGGFVARELIAEMETSSFQHPQLFPDDMRIVLRPRTREIPKRAIEETAFAPPGRAQPTGQCVQFEDARTVTVYLGVTTRQKPGDAGDVDEETGHAPGNSPTNR